MYLLCCNASCVSHRTWTATWRRRATMSPSGRHGHALAEAAVAGTRAWTALGHREAPSLKPYM